jgi:hypothetical protein
MTLGRDNPTQDILTRTYLLATHGKLTPHNNMTRTVYVIGFSERIPSLFVIEEGVNEWKSMYVIQVKVKPVQS